MDAQLPDVTTPRPDAPTGDSSSVETFPDAPGDSSDAGPDMECGAGTTLCNGVVCVDLGSSPTNCGACNNTCSGSGSLIACCDAACVNNSSDPMNCGGCGVVCEAGSACEAGICR
jgi:hypothetical protein